MTEQAETGAAAGAANTHGPRVLEDQAANVAAPCGCGERIDGLEAHLGGLDKIVRSASWLVLALAAGVLYLVWSGGFGGEK